MRKFLFLSFSLACMAVSGHAQTFTEHIQQSQPGKGSITIEQSKDIDNLVNGNTQSNTVATEHKLASKEALAKAEERKAEERKAKEEKAKEERRTEAARDNDEMHVPTVDMSKKVMRHAKRITGFRVQAFAGGNKRTDKQKARSVGEAIKMRYPDEPVYVHFYSPRWICRVGNYRTYQEAAAMLKAVRAMGYKGATIVKGRITVFE